MKRIGILGGMSWESSLEYYRIMNEIVKEKLGATHSANCLLYSFDFDEIEKLQNSGQWKKLTQLMVDEALNLKRGGAEFIVIATNTMHLMAQDIENSTKLPLVHIADSTADEILSKDIDKILLLGTKFTMSGTFYKERLAKKNIQTIIPDEEEQKLIHNVIYNELILGLIKAESRQIYIDIINKYSQLGVKGVVLGCTEIPLLIQDKDVNIEVFDTTLIHAKAAVEFSVSKD